MNRSVTPIEERFWAKVSPEPNSGCWLWIGAIGRGGYGELRTGRRGMLQAKAHRVAYELYKGPIPNGLQLDHLCRIPSCVNPYHLEAVTLAENIRRGLLGILSGQWKRPELKRKSHCVHGHQLYGENLLVWRGLHLCRACRAAKWKRSKARARRMGIS